MSALDAASFARIIGNWAKHSRKLSDALEAAITHAIDANFLPSGIALPPQREVAKVLAVGRGTVSTAMKNLEARGYIELVQGSGARVRSGRMRGKYAGSGRLFSLDNAPRDVLDLSTGALPASEIAKGVLLRTKPDLNPYLETDGYFPSGVPVLRHHLAEYLTSAGIPTTPNQLLITSGAQQATSMCIQMWLSPGEQVWCEDPTYRGALEAFSLHGVKVMPVRRDQLNTQDLSYMFNVNKSIEEKVFYCQTSIHNPTGRALSRNAFKALTNLLCNNRIKVIEDCCSFDLSFGISPAKTLAGEIPEDQLLLVGTLSKLFWGGLRIGWIRGSEYNIQMLRELRKVADLATPVMEQLIAVELLEQAQHARAERLALLREGYKRTTTLISEFFPVWTHSGVDGGTSLWVDTHEDASAFASRAATIGVTVAPGNNFSPSDSYPTHIKLPIWRDHATLERGLQKLAELQ